MVTVDMSKAKEQKKLLNETIDAYDNNVSDGLKALREKLISRRFLDVAKPHLPIKHTSDEAKAYAEKLSLYEKAMEECKAYNESIAPHNNGVESVMEEFVKDQAKFYDHVPQNKQSKVWSNAWSDGHSNGYYEVYVYLCRLVELFVD